MNRTTKILMLVMVLIIAVGTIYTRSKWETESYYTEEREAAVVALRSERAEVEDEWKLISQKAAQEPLGRGNIVFLCEKPDEILYTEVFPVMEEYGYTGTIALTPELVPDGEGCLTRAQFDELMDVGWTVCPRWDGETPLESFMEEMKKVFDELDLVFPKEIYVDYNKYFSYMDEEVTEAGFTTLLHHAEVRELVTREDGSGLFHIGSTAWNAPEVKGSLDKMSQLGGGVVLIIDFYSRYGIYKEDSFFNMQSYLTALAESLTVTDLKETKAYLSEADRSNYYFQREAWLAQELARYDSQIAELYDIDLKEAEKQQ